MDIKKVFISHCSKWEHVDEFKEFVAALGFHPIIVNDEDNLGLSPNEKVKHYMNECGAIIFLLTKDTVGADKKIDIKSNVGIEIGLAEERFQKKEKIYCIIDDAKPPTMSSETYIHLTNKFCFKSIAKLVREINSAFSINNTDTNRTELNKFEKSLLIELSNNKGNMRRQKLNNSIVDKKASKNMFDISINNLIYNGFVFEGETGPGGTEYKETYYELTGDGWQFVKAISE
ncbi:nucleotide-binding protein [Patescibacteria group bacterium]|nr:nucleotide-binding protein [Patescibacteria group bacterium]